MECHLGDGGAHHFLHIHMSISEQFKAAQECPEMAYTVHVKDLDSGFVHIFQQWEPFKCVYIFLVNFFPIFEIDGNCLIHKGGTFCLLCVCVCVGLSERDDVRVKMYVHVPVLL